MPSALIVAECDRVTTERRRQKMCAQHLARARDGGDYRDDLLDLDFHRDLDFNQACDPKCRARRLWPIVTE